MIVALQALFFATPFILAGVGHILVIKLDLLKPLARIPLDGGTMLRGRPVFGRNKTLRGATIMIIGTSLWTLLAAHVAQRFPIVAKLSVLDYEQIPPIIWGMLLGLGCVLGELPNSFLKRQLDINPGEQPN